VLQCVAVCCSVLQCVAVYMSTYDSYHISYLIDSNEVDDILPH